MSSYVVRNMADVSVVRITDTFDAVNDTDAVNTARDHLLSNHSMAVICTDQNNPHFVAFL